MVRSCYFRIGHWHVLVTPGLQRSVLCLEKSVQYCTRRIHSFGSTVLYFYCRSKWRSTKSVDSCKDNFPIILTLVLLLKTPTTPTSTSADYSATIWLLLGLSGRGPFFPRDSPVNPRLQDFHSPDCKASPNQGPCATTATSSWQGKNQTDRKWCWTAGETDFTGIFRKVIGSSVWSGYMLWRRWVHTPTAY